jgi:cell division protein ZapE
VHAQVVSSVKDIVANASHEVEEGEVIQYDPIPKIVRKIASESPLLILEDFNIFKFTDALLCRRLFLGLFGHGIGLVASSRSHPRNLYENGVDRRKLTPFLKILENQLRVVQLKRSYVKDAEVLIS